MAGYQTLLVEDDPFWVDILERKIRFALQNIGHANDFIEIISSFEEAYEALSLKSWHLLVTDIGLGDPQESLKMKGKLLLDLAHDKQVPAIAVSGTSKLTRRDVRDLYEKCYVSSFFDKIDFVENEERFINKVQQLLKSQDKNLTESLAKDISMSHMKSAHALLIGIAEYHSIRPLSKTTNDAKDFFDTLVKNGYPQQNLHLLLDQSATKANISRELNYLAECTNPDSTVIIFFSGHGAQMLGGFSPGEYLCPVEAELNRIKETCISDAEMTSALRAIRVSRLIVFLDACHSGGVGETKDPNAYVKAGLSEEAYNRLADTGGGRVIIASCKPNEVSWELSEMRNGIFTHYLIEGMSGGAARSDGTIWVSNLFGYVSEHVPKHKPQHPFQKSATEDFPFAIVQQSQSGSQPVALHSSPTVLIKNQSNLSDVNSTKLREAIRSAYNLPRFRLLCQDLKFNYDDLQGETLMEKVAFLIEECQRFRCYEKLVQKVLNDHPYLVENF